MYLQKFNKNATFENKNKWKEIHLFNKQNSLMWNVYRDFLVEEIFIYLFFCNSNNKQKYHIKKC